MALDDSHVTTRDLDWAAGFLEGEGTFYTGEARKNSAVVAAGQVHPESLDRLSRLFGGNVLIKSGARYGRKTIWSWSVSGARAVGIMMTLYVMMPEWRRQQIRAALTRWYSRRPHSRYRVSCPHGHVGYVTVKNGHRACSDCQRRWNREYKVRRLRRAILEAV